jgi:hypothetical protein
MKLIVPLLSFSLALNAILAWLLMRAPTRPTSLASAAASAEPKAKPGAVSDSSSSSLIKPNPSLETCRNRLLAAGFPVEVVRDVIRSVIEEPRLARQREFYAAAAKLPWWQGGLAAQDVTAAQLRELTELRRTERAEVLRVLGPDAYVTEAERERYAFLGDEKAARIANIERDFSDAKRDTPRLGRSPEEQKELTRQFTDQHERDLAALLTPEERATLTDRDSISSRMLAGFFDYFPVNETEYRAALAAEKAFYANQTSGGAPLRSNPERDFDGLTAGMKAAFGEDRYPEFLNSQRSEYRALVELQRRYNLPAAAVADIARLQVDTTAAAQRIADDAALDLAQKKAALANLAAQGRTTVRTLLGSELGDTYLAATGKNWVDLLDQGRVYSSSATGGSSVRTLAPERPSQPGR